jgi:hypothetical protein
VTAHLAALLATLAGLASPGRGQVLRVVPVPLAEGAAVGPGGRAWAVSPSEAVLFAWDAGAAVRIPVSPAPGRRHGASAWPVDVAATDDGVIVLDRFTARLSCLREDGASCEGWPARGIRPRPALVDPEAVAVGEGTLLVLDAGANAILVLDDRGRLLRRIGSHGTGREGMSCPHEMAVGADGVIHVADSGNRRIQRYALDGACLGPWGSYGDGPCQFRDPTAVAFDERGDLLVVDHYGHRIQVLDPRTGEERMERRLLLPPEAHYPTRLAVAPGGRCVVSCPQLARVVELRCP